MYRTLHYTPIDRDVSIRYSIAKNVQNKHDIHWTLSWNIVHVFIVISFHPCLGTRHNPPSDVDEISSTWLQFSWSVTNVNVTGIFALLVFCCVVITHSFTNRTKSVTHSNWLCCVRSPLASSVLSISLHPYQPHTVWDPNGNRGDAFYWNIMKNGSDR